MDKQFKDTQGLKTFYSHIDSDEILATTEMVFLPTLTNSSTMVSTVKFHVRFGIVYVVIYRCVRDLNNFTINGHILKHHFYITSHIFLRMKVTTLLANCLPFTNCFAVFYS